MALDTDIQDRLGRIEGKQDTMLSKLAGMDAFLVEHHRRILKLEDTVDGNGTDGIKVQVARQLTLCQQRHSEDAQRATRVHDRERTQDAVLHDTERQIDWARGGYKMLAIIAGVIVGIAAIVIGILNLVKH